MTALVRTCVHCGGPIETVRANARYCSQPCRQATYTARRAGRAPAAKPDGVTVHLDDVLHLLRAGVRLDAVAERLGVPVSSISARVRRLTGVPDGMDDLDVATLRRLVRADQQRVADDARAALQDRRREWRWSS